ncbi:hypothetical protein ANCCAN_16328 [Ancylostoma caninum]|uniref:G-protein coupled receptors family 1 profile domain-containing protein n=1 Tax=Ancylostoma caninum TaxID=29170 RepID=A0A368FZY7_ANCCA|nr:hypothetical protein ANCCAN_16328 [Ancylostoma caninum]
MKYHFPSTPDKIMRSKPFKKHLAYRILFVLGLIENTMLVIQLYTSVTIIFQYEPPYIITKIIGAIYFAVWNCLMFVCVMVYLNRVIVIVFHRYSHYIFCDKNEKFLLASPLLLLIPVFLIFLLPGVDYISDPRLLTWKFSSREHPIIKIFVQFKDISIFTTVITGTVCYAAIAVFVFLMVKDRSTQYEKAVTIQVSFNVFWMVGTYTYWVFIHPRLFKYTLVARFFSAWFWVINKGVNPIVFLIVNRRSVWAMLTKCTFKHISSSTFVSAKTTTKSTANVVSVAPTRNQ